MKRRCATALDRLFPPEKGFVTLRIAPRRTGGFGLGSYRRSWQLLSLVRRREPLAPPADGIQGSRSSRAPKGSAGHRPGRPPLFGSLRLFLPLGSLLRFVPGALGRYGQLRIGTVEEIAVPYTTRGEGYASCSCGRSSYSSDATRASYGPSPGSPLAVLSVRYSH